MTINDETKGHEVRCQPHLLALRMLTRGEAAAIIPCQVATEVIGLARPVNAGTPSRVSKAAGPFPVPISLSQ